ARPVRAAGHAHRRSSVSTRLHHQRGPKGTHRRRRMRVTAGGTPMPKVIASKVTMHYEQQGTGEPLVLIPYLAADHACYAFQVPEYARHFTCISVDLRGTGESDTPQGAYTTEVLADDIAGFMQAMGIGKAHVAG